MYWRGCDPAGRDDPSVSLAAVLACAWLLALAGAFDAGRVDYALLAAATAIAAALLRRRFSRRRTY